jgi:hypothetical protein
LQKSIGRIFGWVVIGVLTLTLLFCIVWFFPLTNRSYYLQYKRYDTKIEAQLKNIREETEKYKNLYYTNKLSKRQMIYRLEQGADRMERLYDSFKWKRGDEITKELFSLKKLIIINYAQAYRNKAVSLDKGTYYNEKVELDYITTVIDRYNTKDRLQKEKYKVNF